MKDQDSRELTAEIQAPAASERSAGANSKVASSTHLSSRIFKNVVTMIGGQGLGLLLSGAATVLLARYLGTAQLGEFGAIYAYVGLYAWLATIGLDTILARHAAQDRENAGSILLTGVCLSAAFALSAMAVALLLAPSLGYSRALTVLMVLAGVDVLLFAPLRLPGIVFQVDLRQWYGVGISLARQFMWLLVLVGLAHAKADLTWIILGRTFCAMLEVAFIVEAVRRRGFLARPWRILSSEAKKYLSYGFPLAMSTLAVSVYQRIDQVMLHKMASDQVLGNYVASVRLTELISLFPVAVMTSLFPILSQTVDDEKRFLQYLHLSFRSLMALVFGACVIVTLFSGFIVREVYGSKFDAAALSLAVLIWSEVPVFFGVVLNSGLVAKNLQSYLPFSTGFGAILNVALNLWLIPRWGAVGSAWATNISYTLAAMIFFLGFRATRSWTWFGLRLLAPPCLLAVLIILVLKTVSLPAILEFASALFLYTIGAWMLGTLRSSDFSQLAQLIGMRPNRLNGNAL
jgi:O-antigen/teichoic acid export membrane protein